MYIHVDICIYIDIFYTQNDELMHKRTTAKPTYQRTISSHVSLSTQYFYHSLINTFLYIAQYTSAESIARISKAESRKSKLKSMRSTLLSLPSEILTLILRQLLDDQDLRNLKDAFDTSLSGQDSMPVPVSAPVLVSASSVVESEIDLVISTALALDSSSTSAATAGVEARSAARGGRVVDSGVSTSGIDNGACSSCESTDTGLNIDTRTGTSTDASSFSHRSASTGIVAARAASSAASASTTTSVLASTFPTQSHPTNDTIHHSQPHSHSHSQITMQINNLHSLIAARLSELRAEQLRVWHDTVRKRVMWPYYGDKAVGTSEI